MSYSLQKLEADLEYSYKRITQLEDDLEELEEEVESKKNILAQICVNATDLKEAISKLKGEVK